MSAALGDERSSTCRSKGETSDSILVGISCRHGDRRHGSSVASSESSPRPVRWGLPVTAANCPDEKRQHFLNAIPIPRGATKKKKKKMRFKRVFKITYRNNRPCARRERTRETSRDSHPREAACCRGPGPWTLVGQCRRTAACYHSIAQIVLGLLKKLEFVSFCNLTESSPYNVPWITTESSSTVEFSCTPAYLKLNASQLSVLDCCTDSRGYGSGNTLCMLLIRAAFRSPAGGDGDG